MTVSPPSSTHPLSLPLPHFPWPKINLVSSSLRRRGLWVEKGSGEEIKKKIKQEEEEEKEEEEEDEEEEEEEEEEKEEEEEEEESRCKVT